MVLLKDPEWAAWSDREIARQCVVNALMVASVRASLPTAADHFHYPGWNAVEKPASHWN
jgi:hypothetical protein